MELNKINLISERAQKRMSGWFWGEIILMIIVGLLTYVGLSLMGMKYALALAVLSGLFEVVPNLGPITATIPAFFIGLSQSYISGLSMIALYFTVQQLENNLIVPMVMSKVVGLQPPIIIIALLIGAKLAGIGGAFLAVPIIVVSKIIIQEILTEDQVLEDDLKED